MRQSTITLVRGQLRETEQRPTAWGRQRPGAWQRQRCLEQAAPLADVPAGEPKPAQRHYQPQCEFRLASRPRPAQRRPEVVVLLVQTVQPRQLARAEELPKRLLRQRQEGEGMPAPQRLCLAARLQALPGVL